MEKKGYEIYNIIMIYYNVYIILNNGFTAIACIRMKIMEFFIILIFKKHPSHLLLSLCRHGKRSPNWSRKTVCSRPKEIWSKVLVNPRYKLLEKLQEHVGNTHVTNYPAAQPLCWLKKIFLHFFLDLSLVQRPVAN